MSNQYSKLHSALKNQNLPTTLFDADFKQKLDDAIKLHAELLERMEELENSPEWKDKDLPWRAEREAFKAAVALGDAPAFEPTIELVQDVRPKWVNLVDELEKSYRWLDCRPSRARPGYAPKKGSRRELLLIKAGVDVEQLRAEAKALRRSKRKPRP